MTHLFLLLPAEKRQDALPDCSDHKLPGSLHLHGGPARSLLPLLVFEVSAGLGATDNPKDILDVTETSVLLRSLVQSASRSYTQTIWSWDGTSPISIPQM